MKKVLFLSSAFIMTTLGAFGADGTITGGAGTCTVDVLGVSADGATANTIATWSLNSYDCAAGQYLDETTLNCTECPVGSYCPGGTFTVETNNSKTACPADYTSDAAATAESECYMGCELACGTNVECPPHSKNCTHSEFKTTGKQYVDATCNAYPSICPVADFGCDMGYSKTVVSLVDGMANAGSQLAQLDCSLGGNDAMTGEKFGDGFMSWPDNGVNDCNILTPGTAVLAGTNYAIFFEITMNGYNDNTPGTVTKEYVIDLFQEQPTAQYKYLPNANFTPGVTGAYMWGRIPKIGLYSPDTQVLFNAMNSSFDTQEEMMAYLEKNMTPTGYQKVPEIMSDNENLFKWILAEADIIDINMPWVYIGTGENYGPDVRGVLEYTIFWVMQNPDSSTNLLTLIEPELKLSYCRANTINIDWNPDNNGEHIKNMCTYDGAITLPADPVKPGYTFTGWKLVDGTTTE